jgi:hypothetical protein
MKENQVKEIKLSDGRVATFKEAKGKDLFDAMMLANQPGEISKLLLAKIILIDGKPITEFDLEEMPLHDVLLLLNAFSELYPFSLTKQLS